MNWIKKTLCVLSKLRWLWPGYCWRMLRIKDARIFQLHQYWHDAAMAMQTAETRANIATEEFKMLRSQVMQLRVSQARYPRTGWEIMAYIPNEVVDQLRRDHARGGLKNYFVDKIASGLVDFAIRGIVNISGQGRVSALIFEPLNLAEAPRAPKWVQALYEKAGQCTLSPRAHIIEETEEQRVRRASQ